jgi:hypothetical protein
MDEVTLSSLQAETREGLVEIRNVQQVRGESPRRWFFSHEMDLLVWFDEANQPSAFQLSYGKYRDEHAIRWKLSQGYTSYRVDDGRSCGIAAGAPLLTVDGAFHPGQVLARFLELSSEVPPPIAEFVAARLREHPAYREGH